MGRRLYRPGSKKIRYTEQTMSKHRVAWLKLEAGEVVLTRFEPEDLVDDIEEGTVIIQEPGVTYRLTWNSPTRPGAVHFTPTNMTLAEFEAFRDFIELVATAVLPIIKDRDRNADEAAAAGDDSFTRIYRSLPTGVVREGAFREDNQSLHDRLAYVLKRPWVRRMRPMGTRGTGNGVADSEQEGEGSTQDDSQEANESS